MPSSHDAPAPWIKVGERVLGRFRIFDLFEEDYRRPDRGTIHPLYVLIPPDWVNVVPVTPEGKVVLIRQFRAGQGDVAIEVPGGMVEAGEDPVAGALRELEEETGYRADTARLTGRVRPNPAIQRNFCHMVLATGCRPTGRTDPDPDEDVHPFEASWDEIDALIADGRIDHSLVLNALAFARAALGAGAGR